ncbi:MAG: hypothetical protein NC299_11300 [Lachnospiraceae bacterium]|nr:hypothetical protein [Ruminococcus sp.]MCM1275931.1 hypothetical protein [Lachnospiraceae bacterium]
MSIKRILAAAAASVVAVSAMAVVANAAITTDLPNCADDGSGNFQIKLKENNENLSGVDLSKVAAFEIVLTWAEDAEWAGGKFITQTGGWDELGAWSTADDGKEFSNAKSGEAIKVNVPSSFNPDNDFVSVTLQNYGVDVKIESLTLLDADGNALNGGEAAPAETESKPEETSSEPAPEESKPEETSNAAPANNVDTGVAGVAAVVGVAAVAAGAVIVAKKRK